MANTKYTGLTNYANYHTFSKLQVGNNVNFGGSINRSGHTVTNTDAWLDDVPFFNTFTTPSAALAAVGTSTVKYDLVSIAVGEGDIPAGLYRRNDVDNSAGDKTFTEIFTLYTIGTDTKDGAPVLLNKNEKAVVRVWSNQQLTLLNGSNNSNANSEEQAARIIIDGTPVEQFIAVPDVCRSGYPSNGYSIKVYNDGTPMTMDFGTVTNTFFDVPFAGVIMFGGGTDGSVYTIDCFEYIGDKLAAVNTKIADIQETIKDLTVEARAGIKSIVEGSGIKVDAADTLNPIISVDTDVIATAASVSELSQIVSEIQDTVDSGVVSSVSTSEAAATAGITIGGTSKDPEINIEIASVNSLEGNSYLVSGEVVYDAIEIAKSEISTSVFPALAEIKATTDDHETRIAAIEDTYATSESVTALGNTSLEASSTTGDDYQVKVSTSGTVANGLIINVDTKDIASAAALSALDTKVTEHIELAAGTYLEVEVVDSLDSVTEPKTNKLYLVPNTGKGNNVKDEYIYTNGAWELIGTTEVDLTPYAKTTDVEAALALKADQTALDSTNAEVAKKANSADVYTKTEIDTAQEATDTAIEAAAAKGQQGITDAAAAKSAADAAQIDATQALSDASFAQAAAETAQAEVDTLEGVVSALSQVVSDNKAAAESSIAAKADQTALDDTNATVAEHTTAIEALESFVGGSDASGESLSELLAKKVDNVTGGSNGITIATADTTDGRVATLSVTPDTAVTKDSVNVVTSGAVETAISASASTTLDSAKAYAEEQVEVLTAELNVGEVSAENTAVSVTQTNGKITAVTVTKGEIADKNTNLVDGGTVYAVSSALQTTVDKKLDSSTYTADKEAIEGRLDTAEGEIDTLQEFVNGANDAFAAKSTETVAANAQTSADKKLASITTSDARITLGTATADGDTKSVSIDLASTVATTTDGTAYSKTETDEAITTAVGTAIQSVSLAEGNTQTAISVATSDSNAVTFTVADNIATVDKVTVGEDGSITVDTEGDVYSKETIDKMVSEATPETYVKTVNDLQGDIKITDYRHDYGNGEHWTTVYPSIGTTIISEKEDGSLRIESDGLWCFKDAPYLDNYLPATKTIINGVLDDKTFINFEKCTAWSRPISGVSAILESFITDLPVLETGIGMFLGSSALHTFQGNLGSLNDAYSMFGECILSADSVMYIADGIKDWGVRDSEGSLTGTTDDKAHKITIDVDSTLTSDAEVAEYLMEIANKGWTVATNHTAFASASASDSTQNNVFVIARPVEDQGMATHTTADGKFVAVETAVSVIGIHQNQWTIFANIEDALAEWELTPITK